MDDSHSLRLMQVLMNPHFMIEWWTQKKRCKSSYSGDAVINELLDLPHDFIFHTVMLPAYEKLILGKWGLLNTFKILLSQTCHRKWHGQRESYSSGLMAGKFTSFIRPGTAVATESNERSVGEKASYPNLCPSRARLNGAGRACQ